MMGSMLSATLLQKSESPAPIVAVLEVASASSSISIATRRPSGPGFIRASAPVPHPAVPMWKVPTAKLPASDVTTTVAPKPMSAAVAVMRLLFA